MPWTMGGYYELAVLVGVASLLLTSRCDESCKGTDGRSGEAGAPGRDGWPGVKGQKGEPAVVEGPVDPEVLLTLKGDMGSRGLQGVIGPKGYRGNLGAPGPLGIPGRPGPDGKSIGSGQHSAQQARSAFSAIRTVNVYPPLKQIITYQETTVNIPGDFDTAAGYFTCRVPGVYYFTFQSVAKVSLCIYIVSDSMINKLGFCDHATRNNEQVLSGGVVLQLTAGQKVWLESFHDSQIVEGRSTRDTREKRIVFSGFLIFSNPE